MADKSHLTRPIGIEGWSTIEPALVAAIASEDPLLLVGPHGSAKSFFLERLALTLGLVFRSYNASLLNYDDLVGIPIPSSDGQSLVYLRTENSIWDAAVVFFDEINRTRPDLQNKLFPIVHERRLQGARLQNLRYRWCAMNPPPSSGGEDLAEAYYEGIEPLDQALADRFAYVIEVPGWSDLSETEQRRILEDQFRGEHAFPVPLEDVIRQVREVLSELESATPDFVRDYLLRIYTLLATNKIRVTARRATMLQRNALAIHAARTVLHRLGDDTREPTWEESFWLMIRTGLPHVADGRKPEPVKLLAVHRTVWESVRQDADPIVRSVLALADPVARATAAYRHREVMGAERIGTILIAALSNLPPAERMAFAWAAYGQLKNSRCLLASTIDALAREVRPMLVPTEVEIKSGSSNLSPAEIARLCKKKDPAESALVSAVYAAGFLTESPELLLTKFRRYTSEWRIR